MTLNELITAVKDGAINTVVALFKEIKNILGDTSGGSQSDTTKEVKQQTVKLDPKLSSYAAITKMTREMEQAKQQQQRQTAKTSVVPQKTGPTVYGELFPSQNPDAVKEEKQKEVAKKGPEPTKTVSK